MSKHKCKRCGKCCDCGTMWVNSDHPVIRAIYKDLPLDYFQDGGKCAMLVIDGNGLASCLIQTELGIDAKPEVCREYPCDGDTCRNAGDG